MGCRGGAVGSGTALQTGRSRVRFSGFSGVSGIFHWHNPFGRTMALGSTQPLREMSTRNISWGVKAAGAYGRQPTTFMCRLSRNLGASTSWNPLGLSRPAMGLLYLLLKYEQEFKTVLPAEMQVASSLPKLYVTA
jgi:hypothetical protein